MRSLFTAVLFSLALIGCNNQASVEASPSDATASVEASPDTTPCEAEFDRAGAENKAGGNVSAQLENCDFTGYNLSVTFYALRNANLTNANFTGVGFGGEGVSSGGNFTGANFTGANLTGSRMTFANFLSANFSQANFLNVKDFRDANFENADLSGALNLDLDLLGDAFFCNTKMPNGKVKNRDCGSSRLENYYDYFTGGDDDQTIFP